MIKFSILFEVQISYKIILQPWNSLKFTFYQEAIILLCLHLNLKVKLRVFFNGIQKKIQAVSVNDLKSRKLQIISPSFAWETIWIQIILLGKFSGILSGNLLKKNPKWYKRSLLNLPRDGRWMINLR